MKCEKKRCGGALMLAWNDGDIKDSLFVIEGECEKCHAIYAVAMQLFEKSKLKPGAHLYDDLVVVEKCDGCASRVGSSEDPHYFSCDLTGKRIKDPKAAPPKWCPLLRLIR